MTSAYSAGYIIASDRDGLRAGCYELIDRLPLPGREPRDEHLDVTCTDGIVQLVESEPSWPGRTGN